MPCGCGKTREQRQAEREARIQAKEEARLQRVEQKALIAAAQQK